MDTARGSCTVVALRSTTSTSIPAKPRELARVSPVGPAPTTTTLLRQSFICEKGRLFVFVLNAVAEDADPADFNLNEVAGRHEERRLALKTDTAGRSGTDDVARPQGRERRNVGHQLLDAEDHIPDGGVLDHSAIEARGERQISKVADFVRGHHPGAESPRCRKVLSRRELRGVALPIPNRHIVIARVTGDVPEGLRFRDVATSAPDDDGELAFVVQLRGNARANDRLFMPDLSVGKPREDGRVLGGRATRFLNGGFRSLSRRKGFCPG